jgi:hypothetical protein
MDRRDPIQKTTPQRVRGYVSACLALIFLTVGLNHALGDEKRVVLGFEQGEDPDSIPKEWELITYPGAPQNEMALLTEDKRTVLHVKSLGSASALLRGLDVDPRNYPVLAWRWKINRVVGMAIESRKDRNDSAARIRVIFGEKREKPGPMPPQIKELFESFGIKQTAREPQGFKIDYIWGNRITPGEVLDYPGSRTHKVVAVQGGKSRINQWISEKRNLTEDFERLFEAAAPGLLGIVILTDTDQTNEGVEAWYSSLVLMDESPPSPSDDHHKENAPTMTIAERGRSGPRGSSNASGGSAGPGKI